MNASGIVRRIDELGRIVIPKSIREHLNINDGDAIEIFYDKESVTLRPYKKLCYFCNDCESTTTIGGKPMCEKCLKQIAKWAIDNDVLGKRG